MLCLHNYGLVEHLSLPFSKQIFQLISSVFSGLASLWSQPRKNKEINQLEGENNWYPLNVERGKILRYQRAKSKNKQHKEKRQKDNDPQKAKD